MSNIDAPEELSQDHRGYSFWLTMLLAGSIVVFGGVLLLNSLWPGVPAGASSYAIAGLGFLVTGVLMGAGSIKAVWVYVATYAFAVVVTVWGAASSNWGLMSWLLGPTLLLILVLATVPVLRRRTRLYRLPWQGGADSR